MLMPPNGGFSFLCNKQEMHMSDLYEAYAEYLEKMIDVSDDLVVVDVDSVPDDVPCRLSWLEWADFA